MTGDLAEMLAAHYRGERAIAAARRWISANADAVISQEDVRQFLRRRRERLSEEAIEYCSGEAMQRWLSSRANRYRGP